jgi:agmatinase
MAFDPSVTASHTSGIFGLPSTREQARLVLIPVPWEVTTSYGGGTAQGPSCILKASPQIDLFDLETGKAYEQGYHMLPIPEELMAMNEKWRPVALEIRQELEELGALKDAGQKKLSAVNKACEEMVQWVLTQTQSLLLEGKIVGVIGGDHSSPRGAIQAIAAQTKGDWGILHFDAHADMRESYQGFFNSHASIMFNVMNAPWRPKALVQVGIRDFSEEEYQFIRSRKDVSTFFDQDLKREMLSGTPWSLICRQIVDQLPKQVYISFDIDGLSPEFCPSTGTPVPGGLSFDQALFLLGAVVKSGRRIIGFDLNEVAPGIDGSEWDGNVGARILYKLCGWAIVSQRA